MSELNQMLFIFMCGLFFLIALIILLRAIFKLFKYSSNSICADCGISNLSTELVNNKCKYCVASCEKNEAL